MDFDDTAEEAAFRVEARAWLEANAIPKGDPEDFSRGFFSVGADWRDLDERSRKWQRTLFDAGWAGIGLPQAYGGRGGTTGQEMIFAQEVADFGVHSGPFMVSHSMVVPAILAFGTDAQKDRFVEATLRGDEEWCQLFSEPGSGSDLASLSTRAVLDGDEWVVNGQKVWTSSGDTCQWGILLARTDPEAPRHRGITYFLVDMSTPGIEVRPLRQMTGDSHFSEVFLTDVRIPAANVLGGPARIDDGWRAALHTLANERNMIGAAAVDDDVLSLVELARARGLLDDPVVRQGIAAVHTDAQLLTYLGYRMLTAFSHGREPGPETSVSKLLYNRHLVRQTSLGKSIMGAEGMLTGEPGTWEGYIDHRFVWHPQSGIAGGTNEVQRNIIGERVLGLPAEPRVTPAPVSQPSGEGLRLVG